MPDRVEAAADHDLPIGDGHGAGSRARSGLEEGGRVRRSSERSARPSDVVPHQERVWPVRRQREEGARVSTRSSAIRPARGRPPALPPAFEKAIVDCIVACKRQGFSKTREDVEQELVIPMARTLPKYPFQITAGGRCMGPGRTWCMSFRRRHRDRLYHQRPSDHPHPRGRRHAACL